MIDILRETIRETIREGLAQVESELTRAKRRATAWLVFDVVNFLAITIAGSINIEQNGPWWATTALVICAVMSLTEARKDFARIESARDMLRRVEEAQTELANAFPGPSGSDH